MPAPAGLRRTVLKTHFLRAPYSDWAALAQGAKREFRGPRLGAVAPDCPTPVVLYATSSSSKRQTLMVLVEYREQQLLDLADDPDSLAAEGFTNYAAFKRYWRARERRGWDPLHEVGVYRLEHLTEAWRIRLGRQLLERLYGNLVVDQ